MMESAFFSFKNIEDRSILDRDGDKLGEVHDVVLNLQTGEIAYVVLATGGFLGMGEKYHPLPFEAIRYHRSDNTYRIDIPKEKLKEAPAIEIKDWPNRPDRKQVEEVYTFYGYKAP